MIVVATSATGKIKRKIRIARIARYAVELLLADAWIPLDMGSMRVKMIKANMKRVLPTTSPKGVEAGQLLMVGPIPKQNWTWTQIARMITKKYAAVTMARVRGGLGGGGGVGLLVGRGLSFINDGSVSEGFG